MKQKIYQSILFDAIIMMIGGNTFAQGVGNHLTMSLQNCSEPALNIIQFDLYVVSDGVSTSDLRANSFQYGVNFDTCILVPGATVTPSYVSGSSDFIPPLNGFSFPTSTFPNHIRIVNPVYSGGNTGATMVIGHQYKVGTFLLTSSANYTNFCPNFTLQDTAAAGHTTTCALVWIGNASSVTSFCQSGTGDGQRTLTVTCTTCNCTNGIIEPSKPLISFFPNPSANSLTLVLPENIPMAQLKIINLLGEVNYSATVNERRITIDVSTLSDGVYILEATVGNAVARYKFLKL